MASGEFRQLANEGRTAGHSFPALTNTCMCRYCCGRNMSACQRGITPL